MLSAFFSRVQPKTSFNDILMAAIRQKRLGATPLEYCIIAEIKLPQNEFKIFAEDISVPIPHYGFRGVKSIAGEDGLWSCILIKGRANDSEIVVYTAGRTFPLYAAPKLI